MDRFEERRRAEAPIETCWDVLTAAEHAPAWVPFVSAASAHGEPGVGRLLVVTGSVLGFTMDVEQTVDLWEPPHAYGWRAEQPFPTRLRVELAALTPATTHVVASIEAALERFPVGRRVAKVTVRRQFAKSADNLVALVAAAS
ncbi:SRPBCC family protein [Egicoccus sp. AB-alg2]|uniref:SRPBCC family protein n=1 Tax=Egicoccus sp. AB-alg2 TaxID=3242693 RepID=UPI00359CD6F8